MPVPPLRQTAKDLTSNEHAKETNDIIESLDIALLQYDPRNYGSDHPDDDNREPIMRAIQAAESAGGGTVILSQRYWMGDTITGSVGFGSAAPYGLLIQGSDITIEGDRGGGLDFTGLHAALGVEYHGIAIGTPIGLTNRIGLEAVDALTGSYAKGVRVLTFATPGDAANYQAGDWVYIRTGNLTPATTSVADCEMNKVDAADVGAGTITLHWPTSKPYAQEYYIAGTSGISSTVVTANTVPFGVMNMSRPVNWVVERPTIKNLMIVADTAFVFLTMFHPAGFRFEDNNALLDGGLFQGAGRGARILRNRVHIDPPGRTGQTHWSASDTKTVDLAVEDNDFSSSGSGWLHMREGSAQVAVRRNRLAQVDGSIDFSTGLGYPTIDADFRAYDHDYSENEIIGTGSAQSAIRVGAACNGGGKITRNNIDAIAGNTAISVGADNWWGLETNITHGKAIRRSIGFTPVGAQANQGITPTGPITYAGWVTVARPTIVLGVVPPEFSLKEVRYVIDTGFDGTTPEIKVGYDGTATTEQAWASLTSVAAASPAPVTPAAGLAQPYTTAQRTAKAYLSVVGVPTVGKVLVKATFEPVPIRP